MALPLHGIGVLVTRPEHQAAALCRLFEAQGAATLRLPAIEIRPCEIQQLSTSRLGPLESFDVIVFTSANAVRFGAELLQRRRDLTLAALGPATARALNHAGYRVALQPLDRVDSEGLLSHPGLAQLSGRRILLIKGRDGRQLLETEFARRGARVLRVEVYERLPATPTAAELAVIEAAFAGRRVHVVTATSVDIGGRLLDLPSARLRAEFDAACWLVPGTRIGEALRARGLRASFVCARSAEDQDLVSAMLDWRAGESGAKSKEST